MAKSEKLTLQLSEQLRQEGKNFIIVVDSCGEVFCQMNVTYNSQLKFLADIVKKILTTKRSN